LSKQLEVWLKEYGDSPLVQILAHPAVVLLMERLLMEEGILLEPLEMVGEMPALTAMPTGALLERLMTLTIEDVGDPAVDGHHHATNDCVPSLERPDLETEGQPSPPGDHPEP
jgi:hypothetical protein